MQAADSPVLDQVVITAQKAIDEITSISTIKGRKLEESDIHKAQDLPDYMPGFNMTPTPFGPVMSIRGISSEVNLSFEQAAPLFVDGVRYGRAKLVLAPFLDIERIDLLRGPQSVLFGKNTTAGAVNIITAKPTKVFEGNVAVLYDPEYDGKEARLILSGPISETVAGRMAIMDRTDNGFIENTTLNRTEPANKERVIRTTLEWKPSSAWDIQLKLEDGTFDTHGRNIEALKPVSNNPNDSNPYATVLSYLTAGAYHLDTIQDGLRQANGDFSYNKTNNITLTAEHSAGDLNITSNTSYNAYNSTDLCDCDFIGTPIINIDSAEKFHHFSQEIRIASQGNQTLNWVIGGLYQSTGLDSHYSASAPFNSAVVGKAISPLLLGASSQRDFSQDTTLYSVFAQTTWAITESTSATLGGRYTQEPKTADRHGYHVTPSGTALPEGSIYDPYNQLWSLFKIEPHTVSGHRNESSFTPKLSVQHTLNATDQLYASYTTGVKSGGFDALSNSVPAKVGGIYSDIEGSWEFNSEKIKNYELGGKFSFPQNSAELSITLFRSELSHIQNSQSDNGIGVNVNNLGSAVIQGLELDGRWAISPKLLMRGGAANLNFEYKSLPYGQCYFGQIDQTEPLGDGACDATGKTREFTPKLQANLGWDYKISLLNDLTLTNTLDVIYSSGYLTTSTLDPRMTQPAFTKINARIALAAANNLWEIALIGKNLTNETIVTFASNLPLASTLTQGQGSGYYAFFNQPRSIAIEASIKF